MELKEQQLVIDYKGNKQALSYYFRQGSGAAILWLHAFCCSKEDFASAFARQELSNYSLAAFNFPGSPNSPNPQDENYDFDDLVEITKKFIEKLDLKNLIVVGHSTGSLVANLLAERYPELVKAIVSVEGNMNLDDCWLTRKILGHSFEKFTSDILPKYLESLKGGRIEIYAQHLKRADPKSAYDYAESVVKYSENALERFLKLSKPKLFIYTAENSSLSYLPVLKQASQVVEIPNSNHWPTLENPDAFFKALANFVDSLK